MKPRSFALPATPIWWRELRQSLDKSWQRLAPRERKLLSIGAVVLILAFVWLALFEPAWNSVSRWRTALPQLTAQAAQLDAVLRDASELQRHAGRGAPNATGMTDALTDSLARAGLAEHATLAQPAADRWTVTLEQAPVQATLEWLQGVPFELRLQADEVTLGRAEGPEGRLLAGRLSGDIGLVLPARSTP